MALPINRREFIATSAVFAGAFTGGNAASAWAEGAAEGRQGSTAPPTFSTTLHKALIHAKPTEDYLREIHDAGFEGVESRVVPPGEAEAIRAVADGLGMRVHSVLYGSAMFNSPDAAVVEQAVREVEEAIQSAEAFGADAVLLVPGRIRAHTPGGFGQGDGILTPRPWEFQLDFDPATGHVERVVAGDNAPYADYIRAQNEATDAAKSMVARLIPAAEKAGVVIALENVWNHLWVRPALFRHLVESFESPWVQAYYDIGNHVKYGPPEEWILALGPLLAKVHVKDYQRDPSDVDGQGRFVNVRDGDVRWPIIRTALDQVGYNGWLTLEAPIDISIAEQGRRMDQIVQGL